MPAGISESGAGKSVAGAAFTELNKKYTLCGTDNFGFEGQPRRRKFQGQREQQGFLPPDVWSYCHNGEATIQHVALEQFMSIDSRNVLNGPHERSWRCTLKN